MTTDFDEKNNAIRRKLPLAYMEERFVEIEEDLMQLLRLANTADEKFIVQGKLASHYAFQQDWSRAEKALVARTVIDGARVEGWLGLAEHFHYYNEDLGLAFTYVEKALAAALAANELVRQVLGVKIRVALSLANFPAVEQSLLMLIEYEPPKGGFDIALESDFISIIPTGAVIPELVTRYKAIVESDLKPK